MLWGFGTYRTHFNIGPVSEKLRKILHLIAFPGILLRTTSQGPAQLWLRRWHVCLMRNCLAACLAEISVLPCVACAKFRSTRSQSQITKPSVQETRPIRWHLHPFYTWSTEIETSWLSKHHFVCHTVQTLETVFCTLDSSRMSYGLRDADATLSSFKSDATECCWE